MLAQRYPRRPVALPDWLDPLFTADEMRAADAHAIDDAGVPSLDLMERAGAGLARVAAAAAGGSGPIRVVAGKGNNGGDGYVCARLLRAEGRAVDVLSVGDPAELRGDARADLERLPGAGPPPFAPARLAGAAAGGVPMPGTRFPGAPREPDATGVPATRPS